jgi:phage/plasmid-like protein (TIGR03299 family)
MAHQIESMFSVKETPWHGLGVVCQTAPNAAEAIKLAGLDWAVRLEQLSFLLNGVPVPVQKWAVVRNTDNAIVGDGVGPRWTPLQNSAAFNFFDPFVESGHASYETAGSLQEGRRVWVLAKLNRDPVEITKGDVVQKFLLLSNSHDGSLAVRVSFTPIRVVCANTLAMAHSSTESKFLRIRHTKSVNETLKLVQETVNTADAEFEATAEQYRLLARTQIRQDDLKKYVKEVFDLPKVDSEMTKQGEKVIADILHRYEMCSLEIDQLLQGHRDQQQAEVTANASLMESILAGMETGRGVQDMPADARGSWWAAYNAVTEHLSYQRGRSADNRLNSLWFGEGANLNQRALDKAAQMAS